MAAKKKYYAYFVPGTGAAGVSDNWPECERMVKGKVGARYRAFGDRRSAEQWLAAGAVYESKPQARAALVPGIYFDAGTGRGHGVEVSVTDEKGKNLLHKALSSAELNRFGKHLVGDAAATNNYGELLALRHALTIAKKMRVKHIFGDSRLVIEYWSKWRMKRKELPEETVALVAEVAKLRDDFEKRGGIVTRIPGGQNPADLGFHRD
jgi:ribonuclease H-related protein